MKTDFRRRRLLVDRLQWQLLGITLIHLVSFGLVLAVTIFFPLAMVLQSPSLPIAVREQAAQEFLGLHQRFWPAMVITIALLGFHSVLISHRIVGPLFSMCRTLAAVGRGDLAVRASIRQNDFLVKEAATVNEMIRGLGGRLQCLRDEYETAHAAWREIQAEMDRLSPGELTERLRGVGVHMERVGKAITLFRLPPAVSGTAASRQPEARPEVVEG
jgi:methyl-accepting chemotaxis protein